MKNMKSTLLKAAKPVTDANATGTLLRAAFLETAAERAALPESELIHLSFDVTLAALIALACAKRIEPLKADIDKLGLDSKLMSRLDVYARAASYAQTVYSISTAPPEALQEVYEEALRYRALLYSDASNLARAGLIDPDAVNLIKNEVGFRNVACDLQRLLELFRVSLARITGRTVTLPEDLEQAELVVTHLLELVAYREQHQQVDPLVAESRLRAVSLMVKAYEQVRRAVQFLRFDLGDADKFAPSIYTAKSSTRRRDAETETPIGGTVTPPDAGQPTAPVVAEQPQVPGGPGGSPFV